MLFYTTLACLVIATSSYVVVNKAKEDPEAHMNVPGIIQYNGYPAETYKVLTQDNYILTIHRIPHGKNNADPTIERPVVFLQHGLECSSSNWITNLPNLALGYLMADAGYDVWLGNSRGNLYGLEHKTLNPKHHEFWEFSWDEMVKYDLDAVIGFALTHTNQTSLYYVGHSQGTLIMFSKLSVQPEFGSKIRKFFALAPVGTVKEVNGMLRFIADDAYWESKLLLELLGPDQFLPEDGFIHTVAATFCVNPIDESVCDDILFLLCGPESHQMNKTRLPVFLSDEPGGTSTQNIIHWAQMVRTGNQQMYDRGEKENKKHYGQKTPPIYDITKIRTEMHLFWSPADWLADQWDVENHLLANLPKAFLVENMKLEDYNHLDFIWGDRAAQDIYIPIINTMNQHLLELKQKEKH